MKRLLFGTMLLALVVAVPVSTMAQVGVSISVGLPPPIVFAEPPEVVVLPDTYYVYAVPGIDIDLFFWNGWWWRPWNGRWYRSRYYDHGWAYYRYVPSFYYDVDPGWRGYYRDHDWHGHHWYHERLSHQRLQRNWQRWHNDRYWDRQQTWGVQGYQPRPKQERQELRYQRKQEYQRRPEVRQYQQQRQQERRQPRVQQPQRPPQEPQPRVQQPQRPPQEPQPRVQHPQPRVQQPQPRPQQPQPRVEQPPRGQQRQGEPQEQGPHGKPEGRGGDRGR
ncbi:MAG: hypothetical protein A4E62_02535 [Syntrophorhabdus sp. PtaU1.Bin002]|nr:MAG: hypothetical protein A4E62_02535 [Syntrophorhabdus sp. PtaU1.Bin002]